MPPLASWFRGHDELRVFLATGPMSGAWRWRRLPARANGQPAFATYRWVADEARWLGNAIHVVTLRGDGAIEDAVAFLSLDLFPAFGVPQVLDAPPPA
jgi:RNA polymerase sigma-70 factor (ECF subfamily)